MAIQDRADLPSALAHADLLVVGAGLFGLVTAECAATEMGARVVVVERRDHVGGNVFSYSDAATDIEVHRYGTHIFHTSNARVWEYVNRFAEFTDYRHHVLAVHAGRIYRMPINLDTMCAFFGRSMSPDEARLVIDAEIEREQIGGARSLEEKAVSLIGRSLYEAFIRGYTLKQWQTDPRDLPAAIITRLPVRFNFNARYFSDRWEGLPREGYSKMALNIATHPSVAVFTGVDFEDLRAQNPRARKLPTVYTGPLDRYFGFRDGRLHWRTLDLELDHVDTDDFQGTSVVNYVDADVPFTRIHDFRHLHPERGYQARQSVIMREYSRAASGDDEPFYPVNSAADKKVLEAYRDRCRREPNVVFGGRLGSYAYLDMDMAIGSALQRFKDDTRPMLERAKAAERS